MTGYTVHTGSTKKFSSSWDRIFGGAKSTKSPPTPEKPASKTKSVKKGVAKKTPALVENPPLKKAVVKKGAVKKAATRK